MKVQICDCVPNVSKNWAFLCSIITLSAANKLSPLHSSLAMSQCHTVLKLEIQMCKLLPVWYGPNNLHWVTSCRLYCLPGRIPAGACPRHILRRLTTFCTAQSSENEALSFWKVHSPVDKTRCKSCRAQIKHHLRLFILDSLVVLPLIGGTWVLTFHQTNMVVWDTWQFTEGKANVV